MKRCLPLLLLTLAAYGLAAVKLTPVKRYAQQPAKRHPYIQELNKRPDAPSAKSGDYEKLLVILVDFQEETTDDPLTTGNGKFQLLPDLSYRYTVGAPPHNRAYFLDNLEAMRYYYLAASKGSYDLQYEVWPQTGAYTLPQPMGYYNPPGANSELFVSRMEEYFKDAFELADSLSPEINFADYGHYMIIHAGSDWQHDIFGDTPSDIPSFFIRAGEGKEAAVDNGSVLVSQACNVPATIAQDFYQQETGGEIFLGGYGALNAVLAHEFGHSLGLVDLYNVYNWQPMVGMFDIMDSGGSGVLVDVLNDGSYVLVEGALPALPGAWSRVLLFEDEYQDSGYLKDVDELELFENLSLNAASQRQTGSAIIPEILRIPLSDGEYILVENRNVDPDNDGGTAVFATDDSRVILYPTPLNDPNNTPSYEYDYLLPSFQKADGSAIGGGILVWRVNDDVIYNQGVYDNQGEWYSNFDNNSVNTRYAARGVEIIEADNLPDIGYDWSWYWTGTQYEYFHKNKPVLDGSGYFVNWSVSEAWKPELSGATEPPLVDSDGLGSLYWLDGIGHPGATMSLQLRSGFWDRSQLRDYGSAGVTPAPLINSSFSETDLPLLGQASIRLLSYDGSSWNDLMGAFDWNGGARDFPPVTSDQNGNGFKELVLVHGNAVELVEFAQDTLHSVHINYPQPVTAAPLNLNDTLFVCTGQSLSQIRGDSVLNYTPLQGILRLASYGDELAALCSDLLYLVDPATLAVNGEFELPEPCGVYEPVSFTASGDNVRMLFVMANSGNLYKLQDGSLRKIFHHGSASRPTQLGLTSWFSYDVEATNPVLFWASGSRIYAVKHDGTLLNDYPRDLAPLEFTPYEHVYALQFHPEMYLYLPVAGRGHVACSLTGQLEWQKSLVANSGIKSPYLFWQPRDDIYNSDLFWCFADSLGRLNLLGAEVDNGFGLPWNGFRNGGSGCFATQSMYDMTDPGAQFSAVVFPNPVRGSGFRLRLDGFTQALHYDIYDINAALVQSGYVPADGIIRRDILIDSAKLASGVYILHARSGAMHKTVKFAVEK